MAYIDYKYTGWKRVSIPDELLSEITAKFQADAIEIEDLFDDYAEVVNYELIDGGCDCEEHMAPHENDGENTIEIFNEKGEMIWHNGKD